MIQNITVREKQKRRDSLCEEVSKGIRIHANWL